MPDVVYEFIRGDDFVLPMQITDLLNAGSPVDISTWVIASAMTYSRKLLTTATVTITDGSLGQFEVSVPRAETAEWPVRDLKCDIQFTRPTEGRVSSETFIIRVLEDQTP